MLQVRFLVLTCLKEQEWTFWCGDWIAVKLVILKLCRVGCSVELAVPHKYPAHRDSIFEGWQLCAYACNTFFGFQWWQSMLEARLRLLKQFNTSANTNIITHIRIWYEGRMCYVASARVASMHMWDTDDRINFSTVGIERHPAASVSRADSGIVV